MRGKTILEMRPLIGHDFYFASSTGDIYSQRGRNGKRPGEGTIYRKSLYPMTCGYLYVCLAVLRDGKPVKPGKTFSVHRLICQAWHGPAPSPNAQVRHLNGHKLDNRPQNLTWGSFNDNWKDKIRHKSGVKLTPGEVIEIREMLTEGYSQATIAKIFSVSGSSIHFIAYGATWRRPEYGLTPEFIQWQRGYLGEGKQPAELVTVTRFERQAVAS
jgi:hypothetical protein